MGYLQSFRELFILHRVDFDNNCEDLRHITTCTVQMSL